MNKECEEFTKGVFLLNFGPKFICPLCKANGIIQEERGKYLNDSNIYREVIVEFNYDPLQDKYVEVAIIRDDSIGPEANTLTFTSPLIKTDKRAVKLAEALFAKLWHRPEFDPTLPSSTEENIIRWDVDREEFKRQLHRMEEKWQIVAQKEKEPSFKVETPST